MSYAPFFTLKIESTQEYSSAVMDLNYYFFRLMNNSNYRDERREDEDGRSMY